MSITTTAAHRTITLVSGTIEYEFTELSYYDVETLKLLDSDGNDVTSSAESITPPDGSDKFTVKTAGKVTFSSGYVMANAGTVLTLQRMTPRTQNTEFPTAGEFRPKTHERALDELQMQIQESHRTITSGHVDNLDEINERLQEFRTEIASTENFSVMEFFHDDSSGAVNPNFTTGSYNVVSSNGSPALTVESLIYQSNQPDDPSGTVYRAVAVIPDITEDNSSVRILIIHSLPNAFTDTLKDKLGGIEVGAEKNVGVEYTQPEKDKLGGIEVGAEKNVGVEYTQPEKDKLGGIEVGAEKNVGVEYTQPEKDKLGGIEVGAEKNVQSDWDETDATSDAFIKNKPTSLGGGGGSVEVDDTTIEENSAGKLQVKDEGIDTDQLADDAVTEDKLADNAVTEDRLADDAVTEDKIKDDAVTEDKIKDDAVTEDKIKDDAVTEDKIKDDAVTTNKVKDGAVTRDKIANSNVTTDKINNTSVTTVKLVDGAVTEDKLANGAVTGIKIGNGEVTENKLANDAVTENKIEDDAVTEDKIENDAVTENKIKDDAVTEDKLADNAVTTNKVKDGAITSAKLDSSITLGGGKSLISFYKIYNSKNIINQDGTTVDHRGVSEVTLQARMDAPNRFVSSVTYQGSNHSNPTHANSIIMDVVVTQKPVGALPSSTVDRQDRFWSYIPSGTSPSTLANQEAFDSDGNLKDGFEIYEVVVEVDDASADQAVAPIVGVLADVPRKIPYTAGSGGGGGLSTVVTDDSLSGDGSSGDPLSVNVEVLTKTYDVKLLQDLAADDEDEGEYQLDVADKSDSTTIPASGKSIPIFNSQKIKGGYAADIALNTLFDGSFLFQVSASGNNKNDGTWEIHPKVTRIIDPDGIAATFISEHTPVSRTLRRGSSDTFKMSTFDEATKIQLGSQMDSNGTSVTLTQEMLDSPQTLKIELIVAHRNNAGRKIAGELAEYSWSSNFTVSFVQNQFLGTAKSISDSVTEVLGSSTAVESVEKSGTTVTVTKFNGDTNTFTVDGGSGGGSNLTAAEIKTLYESNSDTNAFTDADETKLDGVEAGAQVNVGEEFSSAEKTKLASIEAGAQTRVGVPFTSADETKLDGIEAGAEVNVGEEFTTADHTKLDGIEAGAEVNPPDDEIVESVEKSGSTVTVTKRDGSTSSFTVDGGSGGGGGLSAVATDDTLKGDGLASNPLGVDRDGVTPKVDSSDDVLQTIIDKELTPGDRVFDKEGQSLHILTKEGPLVSYAHQFTLEDSSFGDPKYDPDNSLGTAVDIGVYDSEMVIHRFQLQGGNLAISVDDKAYNVNTGIESITVSGNQVNIEDYDISNGAHRAALKAIFDTGYMVKIAGSYIITESGADVEKTFGMTMPYRISSPSLESHNFVLPLSQSTTPTDTEMSNLLGDAETASSTISLTLVGVRPDGTEFVIPPQAQGPAIAEDVAEIITDKSPQTQLSAADLAAARERLPDMADGQTIFVEDLSKLFYRGQVETGSPPFATVQFSVAQIISGTYYIAYDTSWGSPPARGSFISPNIRGLPFIHGFVGYNDSSGEDYFAILLGKRVFDMFRVATGAMETGNPVEGTGDLVEIELSTADRNLTFIAGFARRTSDQAEDYLEIQYPTGNTNNTTEQFYWFGGTWDQDNASQGFPAGTLSAATGVAIDTFFSNVPNVTITAKFRVIDKNGNQNIISSDDGTKRPTLLEFVSGHESHLPDTSVPLLREPTLAESFFAGGGVFPYGRFATKDIPVRISSAPGSHYVDLLEDQPGATTIISDIVRKRKALGLEARIRIRANVKFEARTSGTVDAGNTSIRVAVQVVDFLPGTTQPHVIATLQDKDGNNVDKTFAPSGVIDSTSFSEDSSTYDVDTVVDVSSLRTRGELQLDLRTLTEQGNAEARTTITKYSFMLLPVEEPATS